MLAQTQPALVIADQTDDHTIRDITPISQAVKHPRHSSWMLSRLTNETKRHHVGIDEGLLSAFAIPSIGSYRHFLARMYGFSAPVGTALLAAPGLDADLLVSRVRTGWIASDLLGLGLTPVESAMLQRRLEIPELSAAQALGWLYVSERITLRHELIRNRLHAEAPDAFRIASDYLMSTSGRAHQQWNELGRALDRAVVDHDYADQILAGASEAFAVQQEWIDATSYDGF
ncbi:MAG: biliverdin-producing heme oxygenase [Deltaproteobacteria bacterium]|nr:biliverdin-producing heme oxygenase [Deltaproteobacteria bacterium]